MKTILLMAQTLDGKIGQDRQHFPDWTGKADKKLFVQISKKAGVFVCGNNTFKTFPKPLPDRLNVVMTRQAPETSPEGVWYTQASPQVILQDLKSRGYDTVILAGGSQINALFAAEDLIDEIIITICPLYFGSGIPVMGNKKLDLELLSHELIDNQTVKLHYKVKKTEKS